MGNIYAERLAALRGLMRERHWDAVVLTGSDPHASEYPAKRWKQVQWLTGFAGEAGDVVVTADHAGLWTDTRYFIYAGKVLPGTGFELHKTRVPDQMLIPQWLAREAFPDVTLPVAVAVDGRSHACSDVLDIYRAFVDSGRDVEDGFAVENAPDLLDALWVGRPSVPKGPIMRLEDGTVGESVQDKLLWIRQFMIDKGCNSLLLTALDDIAWMLNVRGSDVAYNPVVISYLLIGLDRAQWFVRKSGGTDPDTAELFARMSEEGVEICPYDDIGLELASLDLQDPSKSIFIDKSSLNYDLFNIIRYGNYCPGTSPVALRKAVKNPVEIEGMRKAHLEDGLAMETFLFWLEKKLVMQESVTERDAADKLSELRASIDGYRGDSFETISAYGEGAALPHYVTPEDNAPMIEPRGLYLCDSGGQYLYGTTDITRTVPIGPCSKQEKEDYTLVLKGYIDLAMAIFPAGTAGCQIDALARNPLWKYRRNFGHGTGHGIGFFLNVHEGPQDIRQNFNSQALLPGMITSDEPGIYREGEYGIRHESLLLCREDQTNGFGSWLSFEVLTLCHIDTSIVVRELLTEEELDWLNDYNRHVYDVLSPRLARPVRQWLEEKTKAL